MRMRSHSYLGHTYNEPDDNLPASSIVALGFGLLLAVGMVLFSGIGAILGSTVFDDDLNWGKDAVSGGVIGLIVGILFAVVGIRVLSGRLRRSGH